MNREEPIGIAEAAQLVKCSEWTLRRLDYQGIVRPRRDHWGRRLYTVSDIESVRRHLIARRNRRTASG
jgi:DNA-binding transcriptional MerR regulator